jgi:hypothetical protein
MKKFMVMATAGIFLLSLQSARAQKEVQPPPVPPLLEGQRPLDRPDAKEPSPSKKVEGEKAQPKAKTKAKSKTDKKASKKGKSKQDGKKKDSKANNQKGSKAGKKKSTPTEPQPPPPGPDEG